MDEEQKTDAEVSQEPEVVEAPVETPTPTEEVNG